MIAENINELLQEIGHKAKLVVVSKNRSLEAVKEAYAAGQRVFAENRVQSLLEKVGELPNDIEWHIIGHLQTNKVKYIAPFVSCIQSVDSMKLLKIINEEAAKHERTIDCLLQIHIAQEESKFGLSMPLCRGVLEQLEHEKLEHVHVVGLMGMATNTDDIKLVQEEFNALSLFYEQLKDQYNFKVLSMGMSSDYLIALACGSNMVRVGSKVFE